MKVENKGKNWELLEDLKYKTKILPHQQKEFTVPKGFETDGASVPTIFMRFFTHTDFIKMFKGAVIHDYLCENQHILKRKEATGIFLYECVIAGLGDKWYTSWKIPMLKHSLNLYWLLKGWNK